MRRLLWVLTLAGCGCADVAQIDLTAQRWVSENLGAGYSKPNGGCCLVTPCDYRVVNRATGETVVLWCWAQECSVQ